MSQCVAMNYREFWRYRWMPLLPVALVILGCAGASAVVQPDHYTTRVDSDGAKRFEFGLRQTADTANLQNLRDGQSQPAGNRLSREKVQQSVEAWMQQDGFCRDGFFIYDQRYDGSLYLVLGECREPATQ